MEVSGSEPGLTSKCESIKTSEDDLIAKQISCIRCLEIFWLQEDRQQQCQKKTVHNVLDITTNHNMMNV